MADNFATRRFNYRDQAGADHTVQKGDDLTKITPKVPDQQIEDWRHAGLVGAKAEDAEPAKPVKA